jgi:hypothetical protein
MSIRFICPVCQTSYTVNDRFAGKKSDCKVCGQRLQVPAPVRAKTVLGEVLPPRRATIPAGPRTPAPPLPEVPHDDPPPAAEPEDQIPIGYLPPIPRSARRSKTVVLGLVAGAGVLCFVLLVVCLLSAFLGNGRSSINLFGNDREPELLAWVPASSEVVVGFDVKELGGNAEFRELLKDPEFAATGDDGITVGTVDKFLVAGRANKKGGLDTAVLFGLNKPFDPNTTPRRGTAHPRKKDGKQYLVFENSSDLLFNPERSVVVLTDSEPLLAESMGGTANKTRLTDDLRQAIRRSSGPIWGAAVGPAAQPDTRGFFPSLYRFHQDADPHPLCLSAVTSSSVRSDRTDFTIVLRYGSREKAKLAAAQLTEGIRRTVADILADKDSKDPLVYFLRVIHETNKYEADGDTVVNTFQLPHRELKRLPRLMR